MKKKLFLIYLFVGLTVIGYLIYRTALFSKYENKLIVSNSKPNFILEDLLNKHNMKVVYLKSFNYDKKCIGFDAIVNNKYYIKVTKLGKLNNAHFILNKSKKDFIINYEITPFPPDVEVQVGQYFSFYDFPFHINEAKYYLDGKELKRIDDHFTEIVFKGNYINFSFNNRDKKDFGYLTPNEEMSVSFVLYNNELYAINTKKYKNYPFKSLHSLLSENSQE
ncbi:hypothetical protein [Chryseobacterium sp. G0201]|uniref:hypothetical protein n=1 Tax=Chryseobacterium sp. G0201 TaxID=2487065 RepID=UPI000F4F9E79|nr:hypothetical protein [Chryseobacterium sp. G0201]AZA51540.1 hypothetical protein EG348_00240 [Chryseobacterium sp. G0201]